METITYINGVQVALLAMTFTNVWTLVLRGVDDCEGWSGPLCIYAYVMAIITLGFHICAWGDIAFSNLVGLAFSVIAMVWAKRKPRRLWILAYGLIGFILGKVVAIGIILLTSITGCKAW